jgi:transposase-like protein
MHGEKRKFSPDFIAQVAMEACKGLDTVHSIAAKYVEHPVQVSTWKKELLENIATVFATKRDRDPVDHAQKEARLYQKID